MIGYLIEQRRQVKDISKLMKKLSLENDSDKQEEIKEKIKFREVLNRRDFLFFFGKEALK